MPSGCVGTWYYACVGGAPPPERMEYVDAFYFFGGSLPAQTIVPGQTIGGQQIGGVVVPLPGVTIPGTTTTVGGPTDPVDTGIVMPVSACAFVTCFIAGSPLVIPGLSLPVVPVEIPGVTVPAMTVEVPSLATVPTTTVPTLGTPTVPLPRLTYVVVWKNENDYLGAAAAICEAGDGAVATGTTQDGHTHYRCVGGTTAPIADAVYAAGGHS